METIITEKNEKDIAKNDLDKAVSILQKGGLVAFPTETVYGLGGNALSASSSKKIYAAKGRPSDNPLIVHISEFSEIEELVLEIPESARLLAERFWPGPMTLVFKKSEKVPYETTGGLDTVAIRMPSQPVARKLIKACGFPIAAPSANASGRPSPTTASHVVEDLDGKIEMIIDGGSADIGLESTIIDVTSKTPEILRPGYISVEDIKELLGNATVDETTTKKPSKDLRPKAPGMKYRHYAPKAEMTIVAGSAKEVVSKMKELIRAEIAIGKNVGIICTRESAEEIKGDEELTKESSHIKTIVVGVRGDGSAFAKNLYSALRQMDAAGVDTIYAEGYDGGKMSMAIKNRMMKAAGYNVIQV